MSIRYLGLITIAATLGCATTSGTTGASSNSNIITEQEITSANVSNAYEVIQKLRPNFLRSRGATSITNKAPETANVYVDGQRYGDTNSLRNIAAMNVAGIRYYSVSEGAIKFGMDNPGGVIEIRMK